MTDKQIAKAIKFNDKEVAEGDFTKEHVVRLVQFWQEHHDLDDDGWCGTFTQKSLNTDIEVAWAPPVSDDLSAEDQFVDGKWLNWDGPETKQPRKYSEAPAFFGMPETSKGSDKLNKKWYRENIVELQGKHALPGVPPKWYFKIHRKVLPYIREGLRRAMLVAPEYKIKSIGGFVFRHIRHDPRRPLSMHAFGCAFDIDPGRNYAIMFAKGDKLSKDGPPPKAWSPEYYKFWPNGVPEAWVQAMASCGFTWGNDWDEDGSTDDHRWLDPMHFEWMARDGNQFDV